MALMPANKPYQIDIVCSEFVLPRWWSPIQITRIKIADAGWGGTDASSIERIP